MAVPRLRVAHVITRMIVGGAQETVLLAAALADRTRFDPLIVCGPQTGPEGSLHEEVQRRGVELCVVPHLVREVAPLEDARAVLALTRMFRERAIDVVHTNSSKAGIVGRLAARRAGVPTLVHTVHGWPFHDRQTPLVAGVWLGLERLCAPLAGTLVVVADTDREKGLRAGIGKPQQYVTVRSGLELDAYDWRRPARARVRAELDLPLDASVVIAVNRLSPQKDPLTLLRAFRELRSRMPDARLVLVGDGPLSDQVQRHIATLDIADSVQALGLRNDVARLLQAADVFFSMSLWEGLPRTIIQAMATGLPVVATRADGVADVVVQDETGLLVPRGDPTSAAAALDRVLSDPALASRLGTSGRTRTTEFDAQAMTQTLEAIYVGLPGRSGSSHRIDGNEHPA